MPFNQQHVSVYKCLLQCSNLFCASHGLANLNDSTRLHPERLQCQSDLHHCTNCLGANQEALSLSKLNKMQQDLNNNRYHRHHGNILVFSGANNTKTKHKKTEVRLQYILAMTDCCLPRDKCFRISGWKTKNFEWRKHLHESGNCRGRRVQLTERQQWVQLSVRAVAIPSQHWQ